MPLAEKIRPKTLDDFVGQAHLVGKNKPIRKMVETGSIKSMIFWGPPGTGKTTLARIIGSEVDANFVAYSAIGGSIKQIREIVKEAQGILNSDKQTILFVDEIHRFNKAQQDAFLPHVENGTITLIGATTENPGFEVNAPLISRSQVFVFHKLSDADISKVVNRATSEFPKVKWEERAKEFIVRHSDGDARTAINAVELAASLAPSVDLKIAEEALQRKAIYYDKKGDSHYDTISAFIKSMRGGDPDATLHYLARMIKAGEDPVFIARRMLIFASEDIGNANIAALMLATDAMQAVKMIGMPEAQLILAQTATYLATSKKSIASTVGLGKAMKDIDENNLDPIPLHLRNNVNKVVDQFGYGKGHVRYPWLEEKKKNKKIIQTYLPKNLKGKKYYQKD